MSLIKCPECQKEISDKSHKCIYCGYPISPKAKIAIPIWISIIISAIWIILTIINDNYDEVMNNSLFAAFPIIILLFLKSSNQFTTKKKQSIYRKTVHIVQCYLLGALFNSIYFYYI